MCARALPFSASLQLASQLPPHRRPCPPCPSPSPLSPRRADAGCLTILRQDPAVWGLEFFKDGEWHAVKPEPDALTINVGDQAQVGCNPHGAPFYCLSYSLLLTHVWNLLPQGPRLTSAGAVSDTLGPHARA